MPPIRAALRAQPHHRAAARPGGVLRAGPRARHRGGRDPQRPRRQRDPRRHAAARGSGGWPRTRACGSSRSTRCSGSTTGARRGRSRRWRSPTTRRPAARRRWCWCRRNDGGAARPAAAGARGRCGRSSAARGLTGLVEPLGFETCSLRLKSEAVAAIAAVGGEGVFRLVHDTFHHHLAGEAALFPALTGLVHISGVDDPGLAVGDMRDAHRVLVTARRPARERRADAGASGAAATAGFLSFEPFADEVQALDDPAEAIRREHGPGARGR